MRREEVGDCDLNMAAPENPEAVVSANGATEQMDESAAEQNRPVQDGVELNCLMRLTDDYLLMTTSKNNAMLFIEKMHKLS